MGKTPATAPPRARKPPASPAPARPADGAASSLAQANAGSGAETSAGAWTLRALGDSASPLSPPQRDYFERRFGADLSAVRLHQGPAAGDATRALGASAFTLGSHVVLGDRRTSKDRDAVLAHELAHVVQQRGSAPSAPQRSVRIGAPGDPAERAAGAAAQAALDPRGGSVSVAADPCPGMLRRAPLEEAAAPAGPPEEAPSAEEAAPSAGLIVDGPAAAGSGQMNREEWLAALRAEVSATAAARLGPAFERGGCPYLDAWFERHARDDAASLERLAQRYSGLTAARGARDYFGPICARLDQGIARWSSGEPVDRDLADSGLAAEAGPALVQGKAVEGGRFEPLGSAAQVAARLGPGQPLDSSAASRIGSAMGERFEHVRVHIGAPAARLATRMNAVAFTAGSSVGFADGRYQPGTLAGEAILAHELAHVAQQRRAPRSAGALGGASAARSLEEADADAVAVGVLARLHPGLAPEGLEANPQPTRSSGLALSRCKRPSPESPPARPAAKEHSKDLAAGTLKWKLEPSGNNSAQIRISFKPKPPLEGKRISFVQTVLYTKPEGMEYGTFGEALGPKFEAGKDKRRIDFLSEEVDPFYGAVWDGSKWVAEGLSPEDIAAGFKNQPSGPGDPTAYMFDRPSVNPNSGERQMFETVAVLMETAAPLGTLRWGVEYGKRGADRWKLLGAEESDCTETPSADFEAALQKFYTARFDAILEGFAPDSAELTSAYRGLLDPVAARLKADPKLQADVGGFADAADKAPDDVAGKRAAAAKSYLVEKGASAGQVVTSNYGASWARFRAAPTEARNRRVQVFVHRREEPVSPSTGSAAPGVPEAGPQGAGAAGGAGEKGK